VTKDEGVSQAEADKGFERINILYFLISLTQANLDKSLQYLIQPDLKFNVWSEFSSKQDMSYYVVLILLRLGDYDTFKAHLGLKNVKKVAQYSEKGRSITNSIIRNDFKTARKEIIEIFDYLKFDPIMSENLAQFKKQILTSFAKIFLKSYTRVKIQAVADNLIMDLSTCSSFLEHEIKNGRLDFKIDADAQCLIKNSNDNLSYLQVLDRAKNMIKNKNDNMSSKVLLQIIRSDLSGKLNAKSMMFDLFSKIN
jgi:hypothetical protein